MIQELATNFRKYISRIDYLKNFVILFLFIVISVQITQAQDIDWGIKGGINFTNHYDERFEANYLTTFSTGAFVNLDFHNIPISLQPEILYNQKGSNTAIQETDIVLRGRLKTTYIEIPLFVTYTLEVLEDFRPKLFTGPSISYLLSSKFNRDLDGKTVGIKPITNNIVWGAVGGLQMKFPTLSERLSLETRVSRGYTEIYKSGENLICCGEFNRPQKDYVISILLDFEF